MKKNAHAALILGRTMRQIRLARGMSQEQVAFNAEIDRTFLTRVENGKVSPSFDSLLAIAKGLGVTLSQLSHQFEENLGKSDDEKSPAE